MTVEQEEWRPIRGRDGYEVSNLGRVRSFDRYRACSDGTRRLYSGQIRKPCSTVNGRLIVALSGSWGRCQVLVAHAVLEAFDRPHPSTRSVAEFLDGDPTNCSVANLRWVADRVASEKQARDDARAAWADKKRNWAELYRSGLPLAEIAERDGCDQSTVSRHLHSVGVEARAAGRARVTQKSIDEAWRLRFEKGMTVAAAAQALGIKASRLYERLYRKPSKELIESFTAGSGGARELLHRIRGGGLSVSATEAERWHERYCSGVSMKAVANEFGISPSTVSRTFKAYGLPTRSHAEAMRLRSARG